MEPIKNLGFLINEAGRMRDLFKAFGEIDGVLKALQAAQNYPAELDKAILEKKKELDGLDAEKMKTTADINQLSIKKAELMATLTRVGKEVDEAVIKAKEKEAIELEKLNKANQQAVEASMKTMNAELENHKKIIEENALDMDFIVKRHKEKAKALAQTEREYNERIEKAKATLANLRKTLEV